MGWMKKTKPTTIRIDPCLGIPVIFDSRVETFAESRGLFRWKRIFLGPRFLSLPPREQQALLLHEAGHCKLHHLEKRILACLTFWPPKVLKLCVIQEFQADRFTAGCGYGRDLVNFLLRFKDHKAGPFHPPQAERVRRLLS